MATAVSELIALELVSRLESITTANGYDFDVESVNRISRKDQDFTPRDKTIVVVQGEQEPIDALFVPAAIPAVAWMLPFVIHGFVRESDAATTDDAAAENKMAANIYKAIASPTDWHKFDSNSFNARLGSMKPFDAEEGDHSGVTITLTVDYRVSEADPFTVRG